MILEEGAEVRDSVLLDEVAVGAGARVERTILDAEVEVGEGARVGGRDADLTLAGRRARIGAKLAAGARLGPGKEA